MKIDFEKYIKDTKLNLKNLLQKISKSGVNLEKYICYLKGEVNDRVIFIGGKQISGSVSPFMHTYSSFLNNNFFHYILFDMTKNNTKPSSIIKEIMENKHILGANVTMPYKIEIFETLKELGRLDNSAKLVGAVNTLAKENGETKGYNTDIFGILNPLKDKLGEDIKGDEVGYVLGAGGAARAAIGALLKLGIKNICLLNRSQKNMDSLVEHFDSNEVKSIIGDDFVINTVIYNQEDSETNSLSDIINKKGILINTLPVGFKESLPKYPMLEDEFDKVLPNLLLYFDIVYNLNHKNTPMIDQIKKDYPNIITCDGIDMVVEQAKKGFEMWSNGDILDDIKLKNIFRSLGKQ